MKPLLTYADYERAARALGCEVAVIRAVAEVESSGSGFLASGEPKILFERHWFSRLTDGRYDTMAPTISSRMAGGYLGGQAEHTRLAAAARLDRTAALMSASWGKIQIMGFNYKRAGFDNVQAFIKADLRLVTALQGRNFTRFASIYNGPGYAKNQYDSRMYAAYRRHRNG